MYLVRSPKPPLTNETANPNAATAAASAFSRRDSNASLSSAAAAAALKARPTTPTNVAEVQSKRTPRRSPSVSSMNSRDAGRRQVARSPSVSSMRERTFRSPSPARSPAPMDPNAPPVPSLPDANQLRAEAKKEKRMTAPLQTQPFKTASEKLKESQQGGSWFGGATSHDGRKPRRSRSVIDDRSRTMSPVERPSSPTGSINFSYPRGRMASPSGSSRASDDQTLVYDPNSRRMITRAEMLLRSDALPDIPEQPVKKKSLSRSGSHLAKGSVSRTSAPALTKLPAASMSDTALPLAANEPVQQSAAKPKKKKKDAAAGADASAGAGAAAAAATGTPTARPRKKRPSTVPEENEEDLETKEQPKAAPAAAAAAAPKAKTKAKTPESKQKGAVQQMRGHSESPARSAHFSSSTSEHLAIRHEPPPRSLSPRKSALKGSSPTRSPVRAPSPSDDGSDASALAGSPQTVEELAARKKSARVSWDDRNTVVVGESTQPPERETSILPSPQATKKPWHSIIGKYAKKENLPVDEEESMSPRPTLPLFGSMREKKSKEPDERPLVRPSEHASPTAVGAETAAVSALTQEHTARNEANTSKFREPLSSATKSAEGEESDSDADLLNSSDDEAADPATPAKANGQAADGDDIPMISVSHPSPGVEDGSAKEIGSKEVTRTTTTTDGETVAVESETVVQSIEEDPVDEDGAVTPPRPLESSDVSPTSPMDDIEEEEEGDRFSDAYEDLSEVDGDGFMSLTAIVDSPSKKNKNKDVSDGSPKKSTDEDAPRAEGQETPTPAASGSPGERVQSPDDWENAKAYWRSLSAEKRRQLEKEAMKDGETKAEAAPEAQTGRNGLPEPKQKSPQAAIAATHNLRQSMRKDEPAKPAAASPQQARSGSMRRSMRSGSAGPTDRGKRSSQPSLESEIAAASAGGMRQSMRAESPGQAELSMRPSLRQTARPSSYHPGTATESLKGHKRNQPSEGATSTSSGKAGMKSTLRRRGSDSSESSFKRARAGSGDHEFRTSMRSSMRPTSPEPGKGSGRFSLRSLSPTGRQARRSSVTSLPAQPATTASGRMRLSMRDNSVDAASSRKRMSGMSNFGRPAGKPKKEQRNASRFGDSSDEEEPAGSFFRSRFADSSDEDEPAPQTKAKGGLAKSLRNNFSTPAVGSSGTNRFGSPMVGSDDEISPAKRNGMVPPAIPNDTTPAPRARRGSIMSILRRKKEPKTQEMPAVASTSGNETTLQPSEQQLQNEAANGSEWPLSHENNRANEDSDEVPSLSTDPTRPSTSGGPSSAAAPKSKKFLRRRSASQGMVGLGHDEPQPMAGAQESIEGQAPQGRKKKFGALRKMFRLDD